jgi:hypothetical protein
MASIDGADLASVTVTFIDDPQEFNDHATVQRVTNAIERAQNLDRILSANNSQVASGKDFIVKVRPYSYLSCAELIESGYRCTTAQQHLPSNRWVSTISPPHLTGNKTTTLSSLLLRYIRFPHLSASLYPLYLQFLLSQLPLSLSRSRKG